jgi:hypothetical protein
MLSFALPVSLIKPSMTALKSVRSSISEEIPTTLLDRKRPFGEGGDGKRGNGGLL